MVVHFVDTNLYLKYLFYLSFLFNNSNYSFYIILEFYYNRINISIIYKIVIY